MYKNLQDNIIISSNYLGSMWQSGFLLGGDDPDLNTWADLIA
jgi:hypothetical protein